jgi:hypothetical protein
MQKTITYKCVYMCPVSLVHDRNIVLYMQGIGIRISVIPLIQGEISNH